MDRLMLVTHDRVILKQRGATYLIGLLVFIVVLACNLAGGQQPTATPASPVVATQAGQVCGDGVCAAPEDSTNCLADCSATASPVTPTPATQGAIVKTTQELRVRFGPSVYCAVLGSYPKDSEVQALAKSPDGLWWQVPFGTGVGWLSAPYTTPVTDISGVPTLPGPYCAPPTDTPVPPTATPIPPTSTPAPVCGNGVIETGEECDTADTCGGLMICRSNCQCGLIIITLIPPVVTLNPVIIGP